MKPAEELLKSIIGDDMEKFQQTFGDTFKLKVQDVTGKITPDIVANLVTKTETEPEEIEVDHDNESEDTDEAV
jgi:hypothetical protein